MTLVACGERTRKTATRAAGAGDAANKADPKNNKGDVTLAQMPGLIKVSGPLAGNTANLAVVTTPGQSSGSSSVVNKVEPQMTETADQTAIKSLADVNSAKTIYADTSCNAEDVKSLSAGHGDLKAVEAAVAGQVKTIKAEVVVLCGDTQVADKGMLSVKAQEIFMLGAKIHANSLQSKVIITANRITLDGENSITVNAAEGENSSTSFPVIDINAAEDFGTARNGKLTLTSTGANAKAVSDIAPVDGRSNPTQQTPAENESSSVSQQQTTPSADDITQAGGNTTPDDVNVQEITGQDDKQSQAEKDVEAKQKAEAEAKKKAAAEAEKAKQQQAEGEGDSAEAI